MALAEDIGSGDITSESLIPANLQAKTTILAKAEGVLAGIDLAKLSLLKSTPTSNSKRCLRTGRN